MSKKAVAANKILKKGNAFLMSAGTVASLSPLKEVQLFTILIVEELSDGTGRFNEILTARFNWHGSKKASMNATHVKAILSVLCK
ncbi:hypothetical protein [Agriterribacter sp.]|uniref:hypothetical protein n=1 Tax=Agriterribacter sp. TaxID=2821509 RepID=UPI002CAD262F|nr:hypothetical protein [Agriterribacter sp.]HTN09084.1 hypothetical protein [Agriterribacter sp.]